MNPEDLAPYGLCDICGKWDYTNSHKCPSIWCTTIEGEPSIFEVYATDAADAAAIRRELHDSTQSNHDQSEVFIIFVQKLGSDKTEKFSVSLEFEPIYTAQLEEA